MQRVACLTLSDDGPHYRAMSEAEVSATLAARKALSSASVAAEKGDFYRAIPTKSTPDLPISSPRIPLCHLRLFSAPLRPLHTFRRDKRLLAIIIATIIIATKVAISPIFFSDSVCVLEP
jgi:hypothetical protein